MRLWTVRLAMRDEGMRVVYIFGSWKRCFERPAVSLSLAMLLRNTTVEGYRERLSDIWLALLILASVKSSEDIMSFAAKR